MHRDQIPLLAGFPVFHRLAESAEALRFTFVRNPCARLLSAWSDRFQGKRLIDGKPSIEAYRAHRATISRLLPDGPDHTLSFPEFVEFATATVDQRIDIHWQPQGDFASVPGLPLNLIGKVESFQTDFAHVLDHIGVTNEARARYPQEAVNPSSHAADVNAQFASSIKKVRSVAHKTTSHCILAKRINRRQAMAGRQYCELSTMNHKEALAVGQQRLCLLANQGLKSCIDFARVAGAEVEQTYAKGTSGILRFLGIVFGQRPVGRIYEKSDLRNTRNELMHELKWPSRRFAERRGL